MPWVLGLEGDKWLIVCLLHAIPNFDYNWIVHDKDPINLEEAIDILHHYDCYTSKKDY